MENKYKYDRGLIAIVFYIKQLHSNNIINIEFMDKLLVAAFSIYKVPLSEEAVEDIVHSKEMDEYKNEMINLHKD